MPWTNVANCLRCGAPIFTNYADDRDFPETRYSCHCWDDNPRWGTNPDLNKWVEDTTARVTNVTKKGTE